MLFLLCSIYFFITLTKPNIVSVCKLTKTSNLEETPSKDLNNANKFKNSSNQKEEKKGVNGNFEVLNKTEIEILKNQLKSEYFIVS